jgi:Domain of unknown function (DUF4389)
MQGTFPSAAAPYPARLEGHFEEPSRWLWLVKWLLVIPHVIVLAFLWLAFAVLSVIAFVAVLFTARYPRRIFDFNVGVLRWSWRVAFYAFAANGTDRYPPFTLDDVPDYAARLSVEYPETQRRGLRLIGWWFLGVPQYVIACVFFGGAMTLGWAWSISFGLIDLLVFVAAVVLLFRGTYPRSIFDLVLGLNRWVLRVVAYAAVMTPEYPPFRVDTGEIEAGGLSIETTRPTTAHRSHWSTGRIGLLVVGTIVGLAALASLAGGVVSVVLDQTQRDSSGYLMTDSSLYATPTYAFVSDDYRAGTAHDWFAARTMLGTVRIRTTSSEPVFVGIARASDVETYLTGVRREEATRFDVRRSDFVVRNGTAPSSLPTAKDFWVAHTIGSGTQVLSWKPSDGRYRIVVMRPDASPGVTASVGVGAKFPNLLAIGAGLVTGALILFLLSGAGIYNALPDPAARDRKE